MMLTSTMVMALTFVSACLSAAEESRNLTITLSSPTKDFVLAAPIPISVDYKYQGISSLRLTKPDVALGVRLHVVANDKLSEETVLGLSSVGVTIVKLPNGQVQQAQFAPPQPKIDLARGQSFKFDFDLFRYSPELKAGHLVVWLQDTEDNVSSNRLEISLTFQNDSVAFLLGMVAKELDPLPEFGTRTHEIETPFRQREMAATWLKKLDPKFQIETVSVDDSAEKKAKKLAANKEAIEKFKAFWNENKDTEEMKARIAEINKGTEK